MCGCVVVVGGVGVGGVVWLIDGFYCVLFEWYVEVYCYCVCCVGGFCG